MFKENLDYEKVYEKLVEELENYVEKSNLKSLVIGISGGIDSTIVAAIAYGVQEKLLKKNRELNVIGVTMPTSTTDAEEKRVANEVLGAFTNTSTEINIDNIYRKFRDEIWGTNSDLDVFLFFNKNVSDIQLRRGNIKSRIRMILLYDAAKAWNGIVLGTDNYSEYLLGFSTIGGDALFDYCPIQYLWKTEVYGLAHYLIQKYAKDCVSFSASKKIKALYDSVNLTPMDGLGISNNDMEQIGAKDYFEVDNILQNFENGTLDSIKDEVSIDTIKKVLNRNKWTEYKRNHPVRVERKIYE